VVKGPSSVLYGQVAPGGTVNYITKRPGARPFTIVNGQIGTHEFWRTSIDLNQPLAARSCSSVSTARSRTASNTSSPANNAQRFSRRSSPGGSPSAWR